MSEITVTLLRLGLLVAMWIFVIAVVGVLRGDLYGTRVTRRSIKASTPKPAARPAAHNATPSASKPGRRASRVSARASNGPHHLRVTEGSLTGTSLPLRESGVLIGRSPESALVLEDDYASARHARIYKDGDIWLVEDLGSTNGTFVGSQAITTPTPVTIGSQIRFGLTVVELRS